MMQLQISQGNITKTNVQKPRKKLTIEEVLFEKNRSSVIQEMIRNPNDLGLRLILADLLSERNDKRSIHVVRDLQRIDEGKLTKHDSDSIEKFKKSFKGVKPLGWINSYLKGAYFTNHEILKKVLDSKYSFLLRDEDVILGFQPNKDTIPLLGNFGFDPTKVRGPLEVFIPKEPGVTMEEAWVRAKTENKIIASNMRLDLALSAGTREWKRIKKGFWCWTGTMTGYVEPDTTFKKGGEWSDTLQRHVIIYTDPVTEQRWIFPIPEEHLDISNAIFAVECSDYQIISDGKDRIVQAAKVDLIKNFPAENGWYFTDQTHCIPFGEPVDGSNPNARHLLKAENKKRVGLDTCGCDYVGNYRRDVGLSHLPSFELGVIIESYVLM